MITIEFQNLKPASIGQWFTAFHQKMPFLEKTTVCRHGQDMPFDLFQHTFCDEYLQLEIKSIESNREQQLLEGILFDCYSDLFIENQFSTNYVQQLIIPANFHREKVDGCWRITKPLFALLSPLGFVRALVQSQSWLRIAFEVKIITPEQFKNLFNPNE